MSVLAITDTLGTIKAHVRNEAPNGFSKDMALGTLAMAIDQHGCQKQMNTLDPNDLAFLKGAMESGTPATGQLHQQLSGGLIERAKAAAEKLAEELAETAKAVGGLGGKAAEKLAETAAEAAAKAVQGAKRVVGDLGRKAAEVEAVAGGLMETVANATGSQSIADASESILASHRPVESDSEDAAFQRRLDLATQSGSRLHALADGQLQARLDLATQSPPVRLALSAKSESGPPPSAGTELQICIDRVTKSGSVARASNKAERPTHLELVMQSELSRQVSADNKLQARIGSSRLSKSLPRASQDHELQRHVDRMTKSASRRLDSADMKLQAIITQAKQNSAKATGKSESMRRLQASIDSAAVYCAQTRNQNHDDDRLQVAIDNAMTTIQPKASSAVPVHTPDQVSKSNASYMDLHDRLRKHGADAHATHVSGIQMALEAIEKCELSQDVLVEPA